MVKLTIWGSLAECEGAELESLTHPAIAITAVRVSDYDGKQSFTAPLTSMTSV